MKATKIFSAFASVLLMMNSCSQDDIMNDIAPENAAPGVYVRLTGAAAADDNAPATRATTAAETTEKTINSVVAALFDINDGFYKTVDATKVGNDGTYTFSCEKDGTYDVYLIANANATLKTALQSIPKGTKANNTTSGLAGVIASQNCDTQSQFLMISKYPDRVMTRINTVQNMGDHHMERLSARFDIVNKAPGVTVTGVTFEKRTVKASMLTRNTMPTTADWFEASKTYTMNLVGNATTPTQNTKTIYSYENYSAKGSANRPVITINYTEGGTAKTQVVELNDPTSTGVLAIKRNHLYRIILSKATKLNFNVEVLDWTSDAPFSQTVLPVDGIDAISSEEQQALNQKLMVYDLFTEYNVETLNTTTKTVTFFNKHTIYDLPESKFWSYDLMRNNKLTESDVIFKDAANNEYRLPTAGEVMLLTPIDQTNTYIFPETTETRTLFATFQTTWKPSHDEFTERVYLKNNGAKQMDTQADITNESINGFTGTTILKEGFKTYNFPYSTDENGTETYSPTSTRLRSLNSSYGIRFKGTNQYAAYRWECTYANNNTADRVVTVRIKALPKDKDFNIDDIVDNTAYWSKDYIEYIFPMSGFRGYHTDGTYGNSGVSGQASYLTSTVSVRHSGYFIRYLAHYTQSRCTSGASNTKNCLRLVKVKK